MRKSHTGLAVAAVAALATLTACGTGKAGSAQANSTSSPQTSAAATAPSSDATAVTSNNAPQPAATTAHPISSYNAPRTATAAPTHTAPAVSTAVPTPASTCSDHRGFGKVVHMTGFEPGPGVATYQLTQFVCGPNVPNDSYDQPTGAPVSAVLAPNAVITMLNPSMQPVTISPAKFQEVVIHPETVDPTVWLMTGNIYGVDYDASGHITSITEIFHP